jgi:hypothetical protein
MRRTLATTFGVLGMTLGLACLAGPRSAAAAVALAPAPDAALQAPAVQQVQYHDHFRHHSYYRRRHHHYERYRHYR